MRKLMFVVVAGAMLPVAVAACSSSSGSGSPPSQDSGVSETAVPDSGGHDATQDSGVPDSSQESAAPDASQDSGAPESGAGPNTITGTVLNAGNGKGADAVVSVEGQSAHANTNPSDGTFTITGVQPGTVFVRADPGPTNLGLLPTEIRLAVTLPDGGTVSAGTLWMVDPPTDGATFTGMNSACATCHPTETAKTKASSLWRSLYRIQRTDSANPLNANSGEWASAGLLNDKPLTTPRTVMIPLAGTIALTGTLVPPASNGGFTVATTTVTGTGTQWASGAACTNGDGQTNCQLQVNDVLGYTAAGLGWTAIGTIAAVTDTTITLAANAKLAATYDASLNPVLSLSGAKYSVARLSRSGLTSMLPVDVNDIVAPAWPGVKATNPNYAPTDPCIYGNGTCLESGTTKYADGQVFVYMCNLKGSPGYPRDEYVQKFGGNPYTCADGSFWDGTAALPAVPMVHVAVVYGGRGDEADNSHAAKPNMNVAKQRWLGRIADVRATRYWTNTANTNANNGYDDAASRDADSFILPIQILQHGTPVNGAYKMNGYHPTENKFPGESWTMRSRTFAHACAGCHNTGLQYTFKEEDITTLPFVRDDGTGVTGKPQVEFNVTKYSFIDENISCEHCHGPASQHVAGSSISPSRVNGGKIVNPAFLTAEMDRQQCGKCHAFDDGGKANMSATSATANLLEAGGDSSPWNQFFASKLGNGNYVPGVHELFPVVDDGTGKNLNPVGDGPVKGGFLGHYEDRTGDEEAFWNTKKTGGTLFGQQHRQQYAMFEQSKMANNSRQKLTCSSCHDAHDAYLGNPATTDSTNTTWVFQKADYRNNVACLSCHAGSGDYATVSKADVAEVHLDYVAKNPTYSVGGGVTKGGSAYTSAGAAALAAAQTNIATAVTQHMQSRAGMALLGGATYNPTSEADYTGTPVKDSLGIVTNGPVGRCTGCHMPKVSKSGRYWTGTTAAGENAIIDGDQGSHVFGPVLQSTDPPLSVSGPSFQSGEYDYWVGPAGARYQLYGRMPNSCSRCHTDKRPASIVVPDLPAGSGVWPAYWPLSEHVADVPPTIPTTCGTNADGTVMLCTTKTAP